MKKEYRKVIGLTILVAAIICAIAYAGQHSENDTLPSAAMAVVERMYPHREIAKTEAEEVTLVVYEVDFADGGSIMVSADGIIVSVETIESMQSIPSSVAKTINAESVGANVNAIEKEIIFSAAKFVKLTGIKTIYEAKMNKDGSEIEVRIDPAGAVIDTEVKSNDDDDDDADDEDDDEDDDDNEDDDDDDDADDEDDDEDEDDDDED